ncbi:MAG: succinylglutamate desuccinylase [Inquilinus sp.]|nr:succinylglutamate desuccinylase [Inquilinus sp.]
MTDRTAAPEYPVELEAPDIEPYRAGNTGVEYYTSYRSDRPGPHVLINAVTHGNELCGAIALDFLFRHDIRPLCGTLTLGFANVAAYHSFDRANPTASRFVDEDFNRLWNESTLDGPRQSRELVRAREIRGLIDTVDMLFDIHSMQHKTPPLMMAGPLSKGRALAQALDTPRYVVCDSGHAAGKRLRDYAGFGKEDDPRNALLIECGQHWERGADDLAIESTLRVLLHFGMIDRDFAEPHLTADLPAQQVIEVTEAVTISSDSFTFAEDFRGMEVLPAAGTPIGTDGDKPVLTPYDNCVLIMPSRRLSRGQTAVRLGRLVG